MAKTDGILIDNVCFYGEAEIKVLLARKRYDLVVAYQRLLIYAHQGDDEICIYENIEMNELFAAIADISIEQANELIQYLGDQYLININKSEGEVRKVKFTILEYIS